jgi:hypothetical protein
MQLGGHADFSRSFISSCVWPDNFKLDQTASVHQMLCISLENPTETLEIIRQAFREESMSCIQVFELYVLFRTDPKKTSHVKSQHGFDYAHHFVSNLLDVKMVSMVLTFHMACLVWVCPEHVKSEDHAHHFDIKGIAHKNGEHGLDYAHHVKSQHFHIKGIAHKEFILTGQSILHTMVMFYGDCVKTSP